MPLKGMTEVVKKRILIVEDDPDILELLNLTFIDEGYEVVLSKIAVDTTWVEGIHPDLLIMDICLKGSLVNGNELCALLKSNALIKNLPVFLLSAEINIQQLCKDCGADAHVKKPFDLDHLFSTVKALIN